VREHRSLIKYRKKLVGRINQIKNAIRGLFVCRGIEIARGQKAWYSGRELIHSFRKSLGECSMEELWRGQLDLELTQLDALGEQMAAVEQRLEAIAKDDERIQRVQTIPGVGRRTAEAIVTALDDVDRFDNARQVSSYVGLVPRQYQSGETDRNGRITKRGSRLLRTLLLECAWVSVRYNDWSRATYNRIHGGQKTRKKKAAIALARKILVVAWAMLKNKTDWDPEKAGIAVQPTVEEGPSSSTAEAAVIA
jgi:transposase